MKLLFKLTIFLAVNTATSTATVVVVPSTPPLTNYENQAPSVAVPQCPPALGRCGLGCCFPGSAKGCCKLIGCCGGALQLPAQQILQQQQIQLHAQQQQQRISRQQYLDQQRKQILEQQEIMQQQLNQVITI